MLRLASGQGCVTVAAMLSDGMDFVFAALKMGMYSGPFFHHKIWGFPKIRGGYHFGVPIIRIIAFWGLYSCPSIFGNYHIGSYSSTVNTECGSRKAAGKVYRQPCQMTCKIPVSLFRV